MIVFTQCCALKDGTKTKPPQPKEEETISVDIGKDNQNEEPVAESTVDNQVDEAPKPNRVPDCVPIHQEDEQTKTLEQVYEEVKKKVDERLRQKYEREKEQVKHGLNEKLEYMKKALDQMYENEDQEKYRDLEGRYQGGRVLNREYKRKKQELEKELNELKQQYEHVKQVLNRVYEEEGHERCEKLKRVYDEEDKELIEKLKKELNQIYEKEEHEKCEKLKRAYDKKDKELTEKLKKELDQMDDKVDKELIEKLKKALHQM